MNEFTNSLIAILFFISMGYYTKYLGLLDSDIGRKLFKFLFTLPLPILVFTSFASHPVEIKYLTLPLTGAIISFSLVAISYTVGRLLKFERKKLGTLMTAAGITSTLSFALPFINVFYGVETTKYLFLYDFGGAIVVWTFVYYIGGVMGNKQGKSFVESAQVLLKSPMLWALIFGLLAGLSGIEFPEIVGTISKQTAGFTSPLILIGIGIFLNLAFFKDRKNMTYIMLGALIAMGSSVALAYGLTTLFGITDTVQKVVLISAIAPSGALTVPFAVEHELDVEYASALVAATMFFAILLTPVLIAL